MYNSQQTPAAVPRHAQQAERWCDKTGYTCHVAMADWDEQSEALTLRNDIQTIIDGLNTHHRNVNISRVTGSSVAIATGVPAAACAIAAPFTLGVTLIPAIVLGIIAAVGGGVSVGATVAEYFIKRQKVKEVQEKWETFRQNFIANHEDIAEVRDLLLNLNARTSGAATTAQDVLHGAAEFVRSSGGISSAVVRGTLRSTAAGVRITAPLLAAASVVALPLDIVDLVTASLALRRGEQSPASESLTLLVTFLDRVANNNSDCNNDNNRDSDDGRDDDDDNGDDKSDDQDHASDVANYDDIELLLDYDNDDESFRQFLLQFSCNPVARSSTSETKQEQGIELTQ